MDDYGLEPFHHLFGNEEYDDAMDGPENYRPRRYRGPPNILQFNQTKKEYMNNLSFILWMCLFPIAGAIEEAIRWQFCERKGISADAKGFASLIMAVVYFVVAILLWEGAE